MAHSPLRCVLSPSRASIAALVTLTAACNRTAEPEAPPETVAATESKPVARGPIRLADQLNRASVVSSPLLEVDGVPDLAALGAAVARTTVFTQDFERFNPRQAGWPSGTWPKWGVDIRVTDGADGRAMCYRGGGAHRFVFVLPAEPDAHYQIRRRIRTTDPAIDLRVLEMNVGLRNPQRLNHPSDLQRVMTGKFVRTKDLVFVHRFNTVAAPGVWQADTISLATSPEARSLVLMIDDAESVVAYQGASGQAGGAVEICLDDLQVERVRPTPAQEMALLKGATPAPGADDRLGMLKRGQLLPTGDAATVAPPYDLNFEYRTAILAPAPTTLRFEVEVPSDARMHFGHALHAASRPGEDATFRVLARPLGEPEGTEGTQLFAEEIRLDAEGTAWRWFDRQLSLAAFANQRIELVLETTSSGGRGLGLWSSPIITTPRTSKAPPNVVVIAVDTLRADRLSCYGHPRKTSPNIDALAADGVLFEHAVSASNWTSSSFAALFTGLMPSRHQVIHRARAIAPELETLPEYFQSAGWVTGAVAYKAYLYNMGFEQGFDRWFNIPRSEVTADENLRVALDWLERHGDEQFFLFFHLNDPHQPFNQPPPFVSKFADAAQLKRLGIRLPIVVGTHNEVHGCRRCTKGGELDPAFRQVARDLYDGEVAFTDDRIGKLIEVLKRRGVYDDTIVAFVSDHGEIMWDRNDYFGHGGPYMSDELIRMPLIVKPHRGASLGRGTVVERQVRTFDLAPTLLQLAQIPFDPSTMQSSALLEVIAEPAGADRPAISENVKQHVTSARTRRFKYVLSHRPGRAAREYLYDLEADAKERRDVLASHPTEAATLRARVLEHLVENRRGKFVLVVGDGEPDAFTVRVRSSQTPRSARSLFGINGSRTASDQIVFSGRATGTIVLLARLDVDPATTVDVEVRRGTESASELRGRAAQARAFEPGIIESLMQSGSVQAHVLAGATLSITPAQRSSIDADQLATLKALGYVQ